MKKQLFLLLSVFITVMMQAQVNVIVPITDSGLAKHLTTTEIKSVTTLIIQDTIGLADCQIIDSMPNLTVLDLSAATSSYLFFSKYALSFNFVYPVNVRIIPPPNVTILDFSNLDGTQRLQSVTIPPNIAVGVNFFRCSSLKSVTFESPSLVTFAGYTNGNTGTVTPSGGSSTFYNCDSLNSITIPTSVSQIGHTAFFGCDNLKSVIFENNSSIDTINNAAFQNDTSLISITIPASVKSINEGAFAECIYLTQMLFESNSNLNRIGGGRFSSGNTIPYDNGDNTGAFMNCHKLQDFKIPKSVTYIGDAAFAECWALDSIELPSFITHLGQGAFFACFGLQSVHFQSPSSIDTIRALTFNSCARLDSIIIPASVKSIENRYIGSIQPNGGYDVTQGSPSGVSTGAFSLGWGGPNCLQNTNCNDGLKSIQFEKNSQLDTIRTGTFSNSIAYNSKIEIPASVKCIESYAFGGGCNKTVNFETPSSLKYIADNAFYDHMMCKTPSDTLAKLVIPPSVTYIGKSAFSEWSNLASVTFPPTLDTIRSNTFFGCDRFGTIVIPSTVKYIGDSAFLKLQGALDTIIFESPSSLTYIGKYTFAGCSSLSIEIPSTVQSIGKNDLALKLLF
jgi:hypothetical protein